MTKSELIDQLAELQKHLAHLDVELGVKSVLEQMSAALANGERIEIRGFGSLALPGAAHGRNPKTGESVALPASTCPTQPGSACASASIFPRVDSICTGSLSY
jgi:integration host factor subunit beta